MSMSKKDFIALADALRPVLKVEHVAADGTRSYGDARIVDAVADFCQKQNPLFKRDRWMGYLNGTNGKNGGKVA
jgi:hypothetical protein